jgi:hypothetical protein
MKFVYNTRSLAPVGAECLQKLVQAAEAMVAKACRLKPAEMPLSDEGKGWLENFQRNPDEKVRKDLQLMSWALYPKSSIKDTVFVDHGGAMGMMSCFARLIGIPVVVYNDIYEPWCKDARVLGQSMGCVADKYVCGEIADISAALQSWPTLSCAFVSVNVIEHIYDMGDFLKRAAALPCQGVTLVLSTSANPLNPMVRRRHFQQHLEWELKDGPHPGFVHAQNARAFYKVRLDIIKAAAPKLSQGDLEKLATATRGLRKDDIEACVAEYLKTGAISAQPEHPTNTCDPMTGCWEERLLDIDSVSKALEALGFKVRIAGGYYSGESSNPAVRGAKKTAAFVMNHAISLLGREGARLAPCFMFHAARN